MPNQLQFNIEEINAADPGGVRGVVATSVVEALKSLGTMRGTTFERDAIYGVPTTPVTQLALQGRRYYNTEVGGWQQYYAQKATGNPLGATNAGWIDDYSGDRAATGFNSGWSSNGDLLYSRTNGMVYMSGILNRSSGTTVGNVFLLPLGFRPPNRVSGLTQASGQAIAEFAVRPEGNVEIANNRVTTTSMTITAVWPAVL